MKRQKAFNVTARQMIKLNKLRARLAESGYFICIVARRFRRQKHDFLAVNKSNRNEFFVVRPKRDGSVTIAPNGQPHRPHAVAGIIEDMRSSALFVRWLPQIFSKRTNLRLEHFLTERGELEYRRLTQKQTPAG